MTREGRHDRVRSRGCGVGKGCEIRLLQPAHEGADHRPGHNRSSGGMSANAYERTLESELARVRRQRNTLLRALVDFENWYTAQASKLPGEWPAVVLAARKAISDVERASS
jgi:predicted RNase H-like nuclease (RuvC/YqgF family)